MNKLEIKIGEKIHTATIGIKALELFAKSEKITFGSVIGKIWKAYDNNKKGEENFELIDFRMFDIPKLLFYSIAFENPDAITMDEVYSDIEQNGIFAEKYETFSVKLFESIAIFIKQEDLGKPKATKRKS